MYFVLGGERVMERAAEMYQQWADAFASIGYSHISTDTAAKILAVLSVYGGHNEYFTHSTMLITDVKAAQRMFNLNGGEVPDAEGVSLIKHYIAELNADIERHTADQRECGVEWATKLFREKYKFKNLII